MWWNLPPPLFVLLLVKFLFYDSYNAFQMDLQWLVRMFPDELLMPTLFLEPGALYRYEVPEICYSLEV
jgi:hypothetical protein